MLSLLEQFVDEISVRQLKLILLVGGSRSSKTTLLSRLAQSRCVKVMNLSAELGKRLAALPKRQRSLQTNGVLRSVIDEYASENLLMLDSIELLFDKSLKLNPLDLLKRQAQTRRVVAVWPGELRDGRLSYAEIGHPEHQNYGVDGLVLIEVGSEKS